MSLPLATSTWDDEEYDAIQRVIKSDRFSMGPEVEQFEKEFASFFGSKYAIMSNSGSSANLLAVAGMIYAKGIDLKPGDEVLVPAVSWSTTYFPVHQYGLTMRFVDINEETLNIDLDAVEEAITEKTKLIFAVNLLGNSVDYHRLLEIADKNNLHVIEDNCESLGATISGKQAGTFGLAGTFSCFFSHHISTMEGGITVTDDEELYHVMLSLRAHGWTRNLPQENHVIEKSNDPFMESFRFVLPGYNLRPLEMSGAIGQAQLRKVDDIIAGRRRNAVTFQNLMKEIPEIMIQREIGESSWFGFSIVLPEWCDRAPVLDILREAGIETRPIVAGNFTLNPVIEYLDHSIHGPLNAANKIHEQGFFVGNHHYDISEQLGHFANLLKTCLDDQRQ